MTQLRERGYADKYRGLGLPIHLLAVEFSRETAQPGLVRHVARLTVGALTGQYRPIASKSISMVGSCSRAENLMNPISANRVSSR